MTHALVVGETTKLLDAWLAREDLLDRLCAYNPAIGKFAAVLGLEEVARELSLADLTSMVASPPGALSAIAGGAVLPSQPTTPMAYEMAVRPASPQPPRKASETIRLDTRPIFESGKEPLPEILRLAVEVRGDIVLVIDAPFHPSPLRRLLGYRGFQSDAEQLASDHWRCTFWRAVSDTTGAEPTLDKAASVFPIGVVLSGGATPTGSIMTEVAERLTERGYRLAGVVQSGPYLPGDPVCAMSLTVLPDRVQIGITQDLGAHATSCRLDHFALEDAVGLVDRSLNEATQLLIVNKFGKREAEGAGFRQTIARALENDIPVLVGVGTSAREALEHFAGGPCDMLPEDVDEIVAWCESVLRRT